MDAIAVAGFSLLYQYADSITLLALSAVGLIIIFGMMGVINMAHGELMMIGAYATSYSFYAGMPMPLAVLCWRRRRRPRRHPSRTADYPPVLRPAAVVAGRHLGPKSAA